MFHIKSIKTQLILFLILFAVYLSYSETDFPFLFSLFLTVLSAVAVEAALAFFVKRRPIVSESAVITGLIIGFVLAGQQAWYIYITASVLAISSKYILRFNKKHVFNPAAFGILATTLLLSATTQWKGTYQWYVLLPAGIYFIYRVKKIPLLLSYLITALILWGIQALMQHMALIYIFGYLSYFFIFIMIIEPKTSPVTFRGKILFGVLVALSIFILTEMGAGFDVELASLLLANTFVPLFNLLKVKAKGAPS